MSLFVPSGVRFVSSTLTLSQTIATMALGSTLQLTATAIGTYSDGSTQNLQVLWASDCPDIATVSNTGLVTATNGTYALSSYWTEATRILADGFGLNPPNLPPIEQG